MSSLDQPLSELIAQGGEARGSRRGGGGGGGRSRRGASGEEGPASSSHPLARGGESGGGALRHNRRGDRSESRRTDPYARDSRDARPGRSDDTWSRDYAPVPRTVQRVVGDTVRVSNLDTRNTEEEIRFIFDKIGTIARVTIYYTQSGQSTGTAEVQFSSNEAAGQAANQLDQAEVDGRLMYVQVIGQVQQSAEPVVHRRREDARDAPRRDDRRDDGRDGVRGGDRREGGRGGRQSGAGSERRDGAGAGAARAGRGGAAGGRPEKKEANAVDLDAEMDAYRNQGASKPAADAAPAATEAATPAAME